MRTCTECDTPLGSGSGRGWCSRHYSRWRKYGDVRGRLEGCSVCGDYFWCVGSTLFCSKECAHEARLHRMRAWAEDNKEHVRQSAARYYQENSDEIRARTRAYREAHVEKARENSRKWRIENPERSRELKARAYRARREHYLRQGREYRVKNRERRDASNKAWAEANRDAVRAIKKRYKLRRAGWEATPYVISQKALDRTMRRFNSCCAYCQRPVSEEYHWDHVVPLSRGGAHSEGNLVPACPRCNISKNNKTVMEWRIWRAKYGTLDS